MPSLEHNGLVEMFRGNPPLAPHLLDILFHVEVPRHASVGVVDSSLDQLVPVEFRADLVVELRDETGKVVLSIILEVQRDTEQDKWFSWPAYLVVERSRKRCPAVVLVIPTDAAVAEWAAVELDLGLGLTRFRPLVLGPSVVPVITSEAEAQKEVELAILSALAHGNGSESPAVLRAAIAALERLDPELSAVYFQIIYGALREPIRRAMEKLIMERPDTLDPLPPFLQQFADRGKLEGRAEGKLEGRAEGKLEGRAEGKLEGEIQGKRSALLRLMQRAGIALPDAERRRIDACTDPETLDRWLDNLLGARTAAEVLR